MSFSFEISRLRTAGGGGQVVLTFLPQKSVQLAENHAIPVS